MGWDKDSLIGKAKAAHTSKEKQGIHSPLPIGRQVFSHPQESRAPSCVMVTWEDKHHRSEHPPLSFFPSFICWAWCHMVWNIPLVSWGQLSRLCPLPASCAPPASSLVGWGEEQKRPWLCKHCSAVTKTSLCYQHCFSTNPKHSLILATVKKINSIPAKISAFCNNNLGAEHFWLSVDGCWCYWLVLL